VGVTFLTGKRGGKKCERYKSKHTLPAKGAVREGFGGVSLKKKKKTISEKVEKKSGIYKKD